jgi:TolA-binding protein
MKCKLAFLTCFLYVAGASADGTVSLTGKRVSLNAPRISIGSYIKNRGISVIKNPSSGGGVNQPETPSNQDITDLQNKIDGLQTRVGDTETDVSDLNTQVGGINKHIGDVESQVNTVSNQVTDVSARVDGVETEVANNANKVYKKEEVDGLLETKQNKLPQGTQGQFLTYGPNGPEWKASAGSGTLPPVTEAGFYIIKVLGGGDTSLEEVGLTADTYTQN